MTFDPKVVFRLSGFNPPTIAVIFSIDATFLDSNGSVKINGAQSTSSIREYNRYLETLQYLFDSKSNQ